MGHEFGKLIATEQKWMDSQRVDLPRALAAELRAENRPAEMGDRMERTRDASLMKLADGQPRLPPRPFDASPAAIVMPRSTHWLLTPFHWADALLPIENDYAARERYKEGDFSSTPAASWLSQLGVSGWGVTCFVGIFALLTWWIRWKAVRLFFADQDTATHETAAPAALWAQCTREERLVLICVTREHVANPHQRPIIEGLLKRGLLTLDPDLRPCTHAFAE